MKKTYHVKPILWDTGNTENCSICFDLLKNKKTSETQCHHVFHTKCIFQWLSMHDDCPLCRNTCVEKTYDKVNYVWLDIEERRRMAEPAFERGPYWIEQREPCIELDKVKEDLKMIESLYEQGLIGCRHYQNQKRDLEKKQVELALFGTM